ncbi:hypothetical protein PHISP_00368 [Aspergillus sp. HF37]|nr:hypothetical protein PHISP_00368 [Aspergillus sp. HF37]
MAPMGSRKRLNPSPPGADPQHPPSSDDVPTGDAGRERSASLKRGGGTSWYPGAWPAMSGASKAAPVTEVARESISVAKNLASNASSTSIANPEPPKQNRNPSLQLTKKGGTSSRSHPADATTTRVNIGSDGATSAPVENAPSEPGDTEPQSNSEESGAKGPGVVDGVAKEEPHAAAEPTPNATSESTEPSSTAAPTDQAGGWVSWLYKWSTGDTGSLGNVAPAETSTEQTPQQAEPEHGYQDLEAGARDIEERSRATETTEIRSTSQRRSWLQMWYGSSSASKGGDDKGKDEPRKGPPTPTDESMHDIPQRDATTEHEVEGSGETADVSKSTGESARPSGWSFWFRDGSKESTRSQTQGAQSAEASTTQETPPKQLRPDSESEPEPRFEATSKGTIKVKPPRDNAKADRVAHGLEPNAAPLPPKTSEATASRELQKTLPNVVLPRFKDTFALEETPSWWQTIGRFLHYKKEPDYKHVYMIKEPPHIKKALAIGIHGYFPAPLIRSVLGQPTGTSIRFSNMAADAVRKWTEDHGYKCDIEKLALEGEGRIADRVDLLWKLLLNGMEEIRKADFIMIACHSQGVPVAIMLVAKLIAFGCMNAARVGICAMAGVSMGPFSDYRSRWISGSAGELFEFALPHSQVSKDYEASLRTALDYGVRICYVGSIDDQLVSLESSMFSPIAHPYIYRAVFVDGRVHAPSFLSHLVAFALKLRNLGISDHGLIRELSAPLAGSLYTGEGHSRIYDDESVYYLAVEFALQTSNVSAAGLQVKRPSSSAANPFILPFAMRGLLEEEYVRRELYEETMELLRQFDDWRPSSKVLKDVKFRLEGIRSKL